MAFYVPTIYLSSFLGLWNWILHVFIFFVLHSIFNPNFWTRMELCERKEQKNREQPVSHTGGMLQWRQSLRGKPSCTETLNQWKKLLLHHQGNSQHKGKMVQATTLIQSMRCWPWTSKGWRRPLIIKLSVTLHSRTNWQFFRHKKSHFKKFERLTTTSRHRNPFLGFRFESHLEQLFLMSWK